MLFYPENLEERLEVNQIRDIIKRYCQTEPAQRRVEQSGPISDFEKLTAFLDQTREFLDILRDGENRPTAAFYDLSQTLKKIKTRGTFLPAEDFLVFKKGLTALYEWTQYIKRNKDNYPALLKISLGFISDLSLVREIEGKIDENGQVKDNATPELSMIRSEILSAERKVRKVIKDILKNVKKDNFTDEDSEVTIREGRLVIPVRAEHKRQIAGFVHDESATGQTVYMEPTQVLSLNNEVREWYYQEKREIKKILTKLADQIRESLDDLEKGARFLILADFIHAKAKFAQDFDATVPALEKTPGIELHNAYHPLLWKINKEAGKPTIPLSMKIAHNEHRMVVISGPNAGGKSVAMKTVGLLQYMMQCGLPISCNEHSKLGIFHNYFLDIGDSQSLENDLSTYSSRLRAMNYFTKFADKKSLILIDEFGSGTEPQYGGAIAESVLEKLHLAKSFGVITTHYANIKEFAEKASGVINASMKFDNEKLEPLYQLDIGKPGSSFALEMAQKNGITKDILKAAKEKIGTEQVSYDKMLSDLQKEKVKYEKITRSLDRKEKELEDLRADYEGMKTMLDSEQKKILKSAKQEAKRIVEEANKQIENTIREIRESQAQKERTKKAREGLDQYAERFEEKTKKQKPNPAKGIVQLEVGDQVRLEDSDTIGTVESIKNKQAEVSFGQLKSFVDLSRLEKLSNRKAKKATRKKAAGIDMNEKMTSFTSDLDVRGRRVEEVLPMIDRFIDEATMLGQGSLRILHGKGHGVLRNVIRTHLKDEPQVANMADEHIERGGSGITVVQLK